MDGNPTPATPQAEVLARGGGSRRVRIRFKLIAGYMAVALLVPMLGVLAISRLNSVQGSVHQISDVVTPSLLRARSVVELLHRQQAAGLGYHETGKEEELRRYQSESHEFDSVFEQVTLELRKSNDPSAAQLLAALDAEQKTFSRAVAQMIDGRQTADRSLTVLRTKNAELVAELFKIRQRYIPSSPQQVTEGSNIPTTLRNQINDLLLGSEGMQRYTAAEFAAATGYALDPTDAARTQIQQAPLLFETWRQVAYAAGGPDDRVIIDRVQKAFAEFDTSANAMLEATDLSRRARDTFVKSTGSFILLIDQMVQEDAQKLNAAHEDTDQAIASTRMLYIGGAAIAFALAGVLGLWMSTSITRPLVELRDAADRISRGEMEGVEINVQSNDEIGELAQSFKRMLASIRYLRRRTTMSIDITKRDDAA